jgi:hypothetical protein
LFEEQLAKIFHSVCCLFILVIASFPVHKLINLMWYHLAILLLFPEWVESYSERCCLCLYCVSYSFRISCRILKSLNHSELNVLQGERDLVSVFYMYIYSFPRTISWIECLFTNVCFWHLCWAPSSFRL